MHVRRLVGVARRSSWMLRSEGSGVLMGCDRGLANELSCSGGFVGLQNMIDGRLLEIFLNRVASERKFRRSF